MKKFFYENDTTKIIVNADCGQVTQHMKKFVVLVEDGEWAYWFYPDNYDGNCCVRCDCQTIDKVNGFGNIDELRAWFKKKETREDFECLFKYMENYRIKVVDVSGALYGRCVVSLNEKN